MEDPLRLRERGVQAVAKLVGHRQHVTPACGEVEQHVRVDARHGVGTERAAALVRAHRCVDPALVEEPADDTAGVGGEGVVGLEHEVAGLREREGHVLAEHRGGAVIVGEAVHADQLRLQAIPALRDVVAAANSFDQRHHRLVGDLV